MNLWGRCLTSCLLDLVFVGNACQSSVSEVNLYHVDSRPILFQELIHNLFFVGKPVIFWEFIPPGHVDSFPVLFQELILFWFQVLVYNQLFKDSYPVLFQVLIWNQLFVGRRDSCPGLFRELISDLREIKIVSSSCFGS